MYLRQCMYAKFYNLGLKCLFIHLHFNPKEVTIRRKWRWGDTFIVITKGCLLTISSATVDKSQATQVSLSSQLFLPVPQWAVRIMWWHNGWHPRQSQQSITNINMRDARWGSTEIQVNWLPLKLGWITKINRFHRCGCSWRLVVNWRWIMTHCQRRYMVLSIKCNIF